MSVRCMVVDDNPGFLESASKVLNSGGLTVVGTAATIASARRQRPLAGVQIRQHGEDSPVVIFFCEEVEFGEDVANVLLDGALGDPQTVRDADVRAPLGHQREHV